MRKWIAVAVYLSMIVAVAALMPVPQAHACVGSDCVLIQCVTGDSGWLKIHDSGSDYYAILSPQQFKCQTSCCTEVYVHIGCQEYPCFFSNSADGGKGHLYIPGVKDIAVFEVSQKDSDAILEFIGRDSGKTDRDALISDAALRVGVSWKWITVEQFKNRHGRKIS